MNIVLGCGVTVHGFEHGPGDGWGLGWRAFFRGARGTSGTGIFPVVVRGVGMGGRCGTGNRVVGAGVSGRGRFPVGWARMVRALLPTRSRTTRRPTFASILREGLCRCGPGPRSGWSDGSSVSRRAATTKGSSVTTSCRAWGGRRWPGWRGATSRSSPRACMPPVRGCRPPRSMSPFREATDRVTGRCPATHEAPVPLREVFDVSTHQPRSLVGSLSSLTRPASRPGRVGSHAYRHP